MAKRLIFNADDYGRSPDISRGIRYAHLQGVVTSTTCMMNMPTVVEDIKIAQEETPNLGLGVHLVLTSGKALLPVSQILGLTEPDGTFFKKKKFIEQVPKLDPYLVKAEWRAQIEAFIIASGKKPTHLDSHHHTAAFTPDLLAILFELTRDYDLPMRLPLAFGESQLFAGLSEEMLAEITVYAPLILEKFQPRTPDAFFASFHGERANLAELKQIMGHFLPNGCFEIMCHPGYVDQSFGSESSYALQREAELRVLTDAALRQEIDSRGIELISFGEL